MAWRHRGTPDAVASITLRTARRASSSGSVQGHTSDRTPQEAVHVAVRGRKTAPEAVDDRRRQRRDGTELPATTPARVTGTSGESVSRCGPPRRRHRPGRARRRNRVRAGVGGRHEKSVTTSALRPRRRARASMVSGGTAAQFDERPLQSGDGSGVPGQSLRPSRYGRGLGADRLEVQRGARQTEAARPEDAVGRASASTGRRW